MPTLFYSHFLRVLCKFGFDISCTRSSHAFYTGKLKNCVTPVRARCEAVWNQRLGPVLVWKQIWKDIASSWNDSLLRDFDWRCVHRVLLIHFRMHQWSSRIPQTCARCGARVETLEHVLMCCRKIADMWSLILELCNRIGPTVVGLSEQNLLLGSFFHN